MRIPTPDLPGCLLAAGTALACLRLAAADLHLERSTDLGTWTPEPVLPGQVLPDGALVVPTPGTAAQFRLRIGAGTGPVLPVDRLPAGARALAQELVDRHNEAAAAGDFDQDGVFDSADFIALGGYGALYHDPAHLDGREPAYAEFKLVRRSPAPVSTSAATAPGTSIFPPGGVDEPDPGQDAGYVTVCLHRGDLPVTAHADRGPARFEKLLARVPAGTRVRLMRFDDAFMVAEDESGRVVASLGSAPYLPDPVLLEMPPDGYGAEIGSAAPPPDVLGPRLTPAAPESYEAFLKGWRENPVFQAVRVARAANAGPAWDFAGDGPKTVSIGLRETVVLNPSIRPALRAESEDPGSIAVEVDAATGAVRATGVADGDSVVTIWFVDGSRELCIVEANATDPLPQDDGPRLAGYIPGKQAGWVVVGEFFASAFAEQPHYSQILNDPQMCPTTVSGCGPTAWALFYAYWDRRGHPRAFADPAKADSPHSTGNPVNPSVLECTRYVFHAVDEVCFPKLDRAATLPHLMHRGTQWAGHRNLPLTGSVRFGLPHLSPKCRQMALDSIAAGRPSIVGIGNYAHYPLAYGFRKLEYKSKKGKTKRTTYDLRLNMGWGDHPPEWRNIDQLWYATNLRPQ